MIRSILEGRTGGVPGLILRMVLMPLGFIYGLIGLVRVILYRMNVLKSWRAPVPVISVGNITAGGTGKTPMVAVVVNMLKKMGKNPAILIRGYGAKNPDESDEVNLYKKICDGVKVYAGANRVTSAQKAIDEKCDVLVMDDGFGHLKMQRDLDIVMLDATCPFGGGFPLPAGLLREFTDALNRADLIVLTHCKTAGADADGLAEYLSLDFKNLSVMKTDHNPQSVRAISGDDKGLEWLKDKKILAVSGIGRPGSLEQTLKQLGADVASAMSYADHYNFTSRNIDKIKKKAQELGAEIVTTAKDAVKICELVGTQDICVLDVQLEIYDEALLKKHLRGAVN